MRDRCQRYVESELSWSGLVPRLADWYAELLNVPALLPLLTSPEIVSTR